MIATWSVEQLADGTSRVIVTGEVDLAVEEPFVAEVDAVAAARAGAAWWCWISAASPSSIRAACGR